MTVKEFCTGERTAEGFYRITGGIDQAIARALLTHHTATLSGVRLLPLPRRSEEVRRSDQGEVPEQDA